MTATANVTPSDLDGLHCGPALQGSGGRWRGGHPVRSGRAPLRLQLTKGVAGGSIESPRPIWTGSIAAAWPCPGRRTPDAVTPSDLDGLHCGGKNSARRGAKNAVTPSDLDGLHCGACWANRALRLCVVTPSDLDGLHCGPRRRSAAAWITEVSPRPIWTGSIAASSSSTGAAQLRGSPRPIWTGSIAAASPRTPRR